MSTWSHDNVASFIDLYRSHECLWRLKSRNYSNRLMREKAYEELINLVQVFEPRADKNMVVKKISNLRNCYRKELKKIESSKASGADDESVYEPKLWYFSMMHFLKDQEIPSDSSSIAEIGRDIGQPTNNFEGSYSSGDAPEFEVTVEETDPDMEAQSIASPQAFPNPSASFVHNSSISKPFPIMVHDSRRPSYIKRKAPGTSSSADEELLLLSGNRLTNSPMRFHTDGDEHDIFGKNVACKLRRLSPLQCIHAEKLINDVLYFAQVETLDISTVVTKRSYVSTTKSDTDTTQHFDMFETYRH